MRGALTDLDDQIDAWHASDTTLSLREWLGMTEDEYRRFLEKRSDRCAQCNRPVATQADYDRPGHGDDGNGCECSECVALCWGDPWDCDRAKREREQPSGSAAGCPVCDRAECRLRELRELAAQMPQDRDLDRAGLLLLAEVQAADRDCQAHAVGWQARARKLETELAYQRGLAEGALERGRVVEAEKAQWEARALAAEFNVECFDASRDVWVEYAGQIERRTIERVAAWLDRRVTDRYGVVSDDGVCELKDAAEDIRSGSWKESK